MASDVVSWRSGWWLGAKRRASPNADARTSGTDVTEVTLVVLHHISLPAGHFEGDAVCDFFENRLDVTRYPTLAELVDVHVSSHFFVRRTGEILQFVSCDDRAWHAGVSAWRGRSGCNGFSIGVEIEGDAVSAFADPQYSALDVLLAAIKQNYSIKAVTTHSEIAPGRKIDPGPTFDWSRLSVRWHC